MGEKKGAGEGGEVLGNTRGRGTRKCEEGSRRLGEKRAGGDVNKQHHGVGEKGRRGGGVWGDGGRMGSRGFGAGV